MARQKKVIDASVIVKWFNDEPGSEEALALEKKHAAGEIILVIPELAFAEILNALKWSGASVDDLEKANRLLWKHQLHIESLSEFLLAKAAQLSVEYNLTIYDAIYCALAVCNGCSVVTADKKILKVPWAEKLY